MRFVVTAAQMKTAEQDYQPIDLMENAGKACFDEISKILRGIPGKNFVIICGRGNNGGDGIVIARFIAENDGYALCVFADDIPKSDCARVVYTKYCDNKNIGVTLYAHREDAVKRAVDSCDCVIDCVYGTGFHNNLDVKISAFFNYINNNCKAVKISIDVPSGVNSDSGDISENAFSPDYTLVVGAMKTGLLSHPCFDFCGNISIIDIGISNHSFLKSLKNKEPSYTAVITGKDCLQFIPKRFKSSHKGIYGKLLNISGSNRYIGAALLSSHAALKCGTGLVTLAAPEKVCFSIAPHIPETVYIPLHDNENLKKTAFATENAHAANIALISEALRNCSAISIGCGLGVGDNTRNLVNYVLRNANCPIILDADGISSISENINVLKDCDKPGVCKIITPHPAEFSRLTGVSISDIQADRLRHASDFAGKFNVIVVLKGVNTVIAAPDGRLNINMSGNAGLAKGGSGDVLTGIIAGFCAQGVLPYEAAVLGVYLHGRCAEVLAKNISLAGIMPSELPKILPIVMRE